MDCRTAQTAPGLTLTGWRSNRPPAFFCFGGSGVERRKTCPLRGDSAAFALPATPRQRNTPRLRLPLWRSLGSFLSPTLRCALWPGRFSATLSPTRAASPNAPLRSRRAETPERAKGKVSSLRSTAGGQGSLAAASPVLGRVVPLFRSFCICRSPCPSPSTDRFSAGGPDGGAL